MKLPAAFLVWPSPRVLALAAGAVVVVVALALGGWVWSGAQHARASAAYAPVLARLASTPGLPPTPEARAAAARDLEAALARYPTAPVAGEAAYTLGNLRYASRDYPRARAAYEVAVARTSSRTMRTLARTGVAYTWEAERNFAKAAEAFQAALSGLRASDFYYEELLIDLARVQELAGRRDEAIQTYRRALKEVPKGLRTDDVLSRLASLGSTP
jgi:tetratricopeptide (TPR) repeat protein